MEIPLKQNVRNARWTGLRSYGDIRSDVTAHSRAVVFLHKYG